MTATIRPVVTALLDRQRQYASEPEEITRLLQDALRGERDRGAFLYVWDRPHTHASIDEPRPGHQLRVNFDATGQWGAINYVQEGFAEDSGAWDTYSPTPPNGVTVWFDGTTPTPFRATAILPADQVRAAVEEFTRTGQRPDSVPWQIAEWY